MELDLDLQVSPEEIMSREVELAAKVGLLSLRVVPQRQCNGHCPCDSICPARQLKQQLRGVLVAAQWRGDTVLTLPLFWRRSTGSPVFFEPYPRSSLHSFVPFPNKPSRFCGRKAKCTRLSLLLKKSKMKRRKYNFRHIRSSRNKENMETVPSLATCQGQDQGKWTVFHMSVSH